MNPPLPTVIVEDEEPARRKLRRALQTRPELQVVGEAADGDTAVQLINELRPALLFLDVQLPGRDGFEVLRALQCAPGIIFTTAHDAFALRAFEVHSVDYLLKPYSTVRLHTAIDHALARLAPQPDRSAQLHALLQALPPRAPERLACRKREAIVLIRPADIVWLESADTLTFVHTADDKLQINQTLDRLEKSLAGAGFVRTHRAALINLAFVRHIAPLFNGSFEMHLTHVVHPVPLSRRQARLLKERFPW